jgi:hypothetical protein
MNSVFGVYRRYTVDPFSARGGAKNSFPFCVLRPPVFLICQHPFSAKHRSLSLPKQALSKSTHVLINPTDAKQSSTDVINPTDAKVHESEDAACPSTLRHAFSVRERLQFVELGAHDEGDSHDPQASTVASATTTASSPRSG